MVVAIVPTQQKANTVKKVMKESLKMGLRACVGIFYFLSTPNERGFLLSFNGD